MYVICWQEENNNVWTKKWELISGEDAMQEYVSNLEQQLNIDSEDIFVFEFNKQV
jgi:hypothetical protein